MGISVYRLGLREIEKAALDALCYTPPMKPLVLAALFVLALGPVDSAVAQIDPYGLGNSGGIVGSPPIFRWLERVLRSSRPPTPDRYREAAESGNSLAQAWLGAEYVKGKIFQKDIVTGYMWLIIALTDRRDSRVERELASWMGPITKWADQTLTSAQIAEAQRLAREWLEKHGG